MKWSSIFLSLCLLLACDKKANDAMIAIPTTPTTGTPLTYLALGDSYTIGEAVAQKNPFHIS